MIFKNFRYTKICFNFAGRRNQTVGGENLDEPAFPLEPRTGKAVESTRGVFLPS